MNQLAAESLSGCREHAESPHGDKVESIPEPALEELEGGDAGRSYHCCLREGTSAAPRMTPGTSLILDAPGTHSRWRVVTDTNEALQTTSWLLGRRGTHMPPALVEERETQVRRVTQLRDVSAERVASGQGQWALKPGMQASTPRAAPEAQQTQAGAPATAWHCRRLGNQLPLPLVLCFAIICTSAGLRWNHT